VHLLFTSQLLPVCDAGNKVWGFYTVYCTYVTLPYHDTNQELNCTNYLICDDITTHLCRLQANNYLNVLAAANSIKIKKIKKNLKLNKNNIDFNQLLWYLIINEQLLDLIFDSFCRKMLTFSSKFGSEVETRHTSAIFWKHSAATLDWLHMSIKDEWVVDDSTHIWSIVSTAAFVSICSHAHDTHQHKHFIPAKLALWWTRVFTMVFQQPEYNMFVSVCSQAHATHRHESQVLVFLFFTQVKPNFTRRCEFRAVSLVAMPQPE